MRFDDPIEPMTLENASERHAVALGAKDEADPARDLIAGEIAWHRLANVTASIMKPTLLTSRSVKMRREFVGLGRRGVWAALCPIVLGSVFFLSLTPAAHATMGTNVAREV